MTVIAFKPVVKEQLLTPFGGIRKRIQIAAVFETVIGTVKGHQAALKGPQRAGHCEQLWSGLLRECLCKSLRVIGILGQRRKDTRLLPGCAHFIGCFAKQRHKRLKLERGHMRVGPGIHRQVGHVGKAGRVQLAMGAVDAHSHLAPIRKGTALVVARGAGHSTIAGQAGIVEQMAAKLDLGGAHGVVFWYGGARHPVRQGPVIGLCRIQGETRPG